MSTVGTLGRLGRRTATTGAVGGGLYFGVPAIWNNISTPMKLLAGVSGIAILFGAAKVIGSAVSNTASLIKTAAIGAIAATGIYYLASKFSNAANAAPVAPGGAQALDADSLVNPKTKRRVPVRVATLAPEQPRGATLGADGGSANIATETPRPITPDTPNLGVASVADDLPPINTASHIRMMPPIIDVEGQNRIVAPAAGAGDDIRLPRGEFSPPPISTATSKLPAVDVLSETVPVASVADNALGAATDTSRVTGAADEVARAGRIEALVARLGESKILARASRLASSVAPAVGVALIAGAAKLTHDAFGAQREYITELASDPNYGINQAALDAYMEVSAENEAMIAGDIAAGAIDPTLITLFTVTPAVEYAAYKNFKNWVDTYAPTLDQEIVENLSSSLIIPDTIQSQITEDVERSIPRILDLERQPPELHAVIQAKQDMWNFFRENPPPHVPMMAPLGITQMISEQHQEWQAEMDIYRDKYVTEVTSLLDSSEGFNAALSTLSPNQLEGIIERLQLSETGIRDEQISAANSNYRDLNAFFNNLHLRRIDFESPQTQDLLEESGFKAIYGENLFDGLSKENYRDIITAARDVKDSTIADAHTAYETRMQEIALDHPKVVEYIQEGGFFNRAPWRTLKNNPSLMTAYIIDKFNSTVQAPEVVPTEEPTPESITDNPAFVAEQQTVTPQTPTAEAEVTPNTDAVVSQIFRDANVGAQVAKIKNSALNNAFGSSVEEPAQPEHRELADAGITPDSGFKPTGLG